MTEQEWLDSTESGKMLAVVRARLDPRLRRFAVECCRRIRHLIADEVFHAAADAGEAFADDPRNEKSTIKVMAAAAIEGWRHRNRYASAADRHRLCAADGALATCASTDWNAAFNAAQAAAKAANRNDPDCCDSAELEYQADIFRCIFGNPYQSVAFDSTWRTPTALQLAESIDSDRAFDRLPILADALLKAGCTNADILRHCQSVKPHVRGCWVVDLILSKQ